MPYFSVIMPLYNKAPYVRKAVESVIGQTYINWELWIVDDGSTDGSGDVAKSFTDPRIHVIQQANSGVGSARNKGVASSAAPFITFLDADDWWEPSFLEEMSVLIKRHPDAGIYGTNYYIVKNGVCRIAPIGVDDGFLEGEINYCRVYAKTLCMPLWTGAVSMPRTIFEEQGGFPTDIKLGEDFLLWIHTALKHSVVLLNKPLSNYNQDVDITYRGTHHLRNPKEHMLWHLGDLESIEESNNDYKQLVDNLRTYGLMSYLVNDKYKEAARKELAKVNWNHQPTKTQKLYQRPVLYLKFRLHALKIGARMKQFLKHV